MQLTWITSFCHLLCPVEHAIIHASIEMLFSVSIQRWKCVCLCQLSDLMMRSSSGEHCSTVEVTHSLGSGLLSHSLTCLCKQCTLCNSHLWYCSPGDVPTIQSAPLPHHLYIFCLLPPTFTSISINSTTTSLSSAFCLPPSPPSTSTQPPPPFLQPLPLTFTGPLHLHSPLYSPLLNFPTSPVPHIMSVRYTMLPTPSALATFCDARPSSSDVITPIISSPNHWQPTL